MPRILIVLLVGTSLSLATAGDAETSPYTPLRIGQVKSQPYVQYATTDRFGRTIAFYLSEEAADSAPRPLIVYVQGSGCNSHFFKRNDRIAPREYATVHDAASPRAYVLIVEKPGVRFLDAPADPGGATNASEEFRREHTLDRWVEAVSAAIKAARTLPQVDADRLLVIGHSEGALVACKVAADNDFVTHVAILAGGGPTQLFDLIELAGRGEFAASVSGDAAKRQQHIIEEWKNVMTDPASDTKMFLGHPYRRWSSFLATSPMEELSRTSARIYIAQGSDDKAVSVHSFTALHAHMLSKSRDVTADLVNGADHSFNTRQDGRVTGDGWKQLMERVVGWYQNN